MIEQVNDLVKTVYSHFVLRDFFGKIIPGFLFLCSVLSLLLSPREIMLTLGDLPTWALLLVLGFSWVLAFGVQSVAEQWFGLEYWKDLSKEEAYRKTIDFYRIASHDETRIFERFVVIKEACGNLAASLFISIPILIVGEIIRLLGAGQLDSPLVRVVVISALAYFVGLLTAKYLWKMHHTSAENQTTWLDVVLKSRPQGNRQPELPKGPVP